MSLPTISIRTNLYLWLLTGRSGDFANAPLNTGVDYNITHTPDEVAEVRQLLKLGETSTDFYVLAALAAAYMSPPLLRTMPREDTAVFVPGFLSLPSISTTETFLPPAGLSWPSVDGGPAGRDGFTAVTFTYLDGTRVTVTLNNGYTSVSDYTLTALGGGGFRLSVDRAAEYGIRADFQVAAWAGGDDVTVQVAPTRYPFADFAQKLGDNSTALRLMTAEGTMQAFGETSNKARKVGMAAIAVMRRMLRVASDDQSGFTVEITTDATADEPLDKVYNIEADWVGALMEEECDPDETAEFNA